MSKASEWYCPNLAEITLNNNIDSNSSRVGQNFNFVLNYCKNADKTALVSGLTCEQDDEIVKNIAQLFSV